MDLIDEGHRIILKGIEYDLFFRSQIVSDLTKFMPRKEEPDLSKYLISPMPGLLLRIDVKEGDAVRAGESLVVIDAMKMENILIADKDCVVKSILKEENQPLMSDDVIIEFD